MKQQWNLFTRGSGDKASTAAVSPSPPALRHPHVQLHLRAAERRWHAHLYAQLSPAKGKFTKSRTFVDATGLAGVKTVAIVPTTFSFAASSRVTSERDRALVSNALDRAICVALSDKYRIAALGQPADMTVRTVITDLVPTDKTMAGVSTAVTLGSGFVLPVSVPRLPFGLGGLAVEAEAVDSSGVQARRPSGLRARTPLPVRPECRRSAMPTGSPTISPIISRVFWCQARFPTV